MDLKKLEQITKYVVDLAKKKGADEADSIIRESKEFNVIVRLGKIESLKEAVSKSLGLRVIKDKRTAIVYTSDLEEKSLKKLVSDGIELVKYSDRDEFSTLPDKSELGIAKGDLKNFDSNVEKISSEKKISMAKEAEEASFAFDKRITNSGGSSFSTAISGMALSNSQGFSGSFSSTGSSLSVSMIADDLESEVKGKKQRGWWYTSNPFFDKLEKPQDVGKKAAKRTIMFLGARKVKTRQAPVLFDQFIASNLLSFLSSLVSGESIYRKMSIFVDKLGKKVGSEFLNVVDDGLMSRGFNSRPFDGEGVVSRKNVIFENGVLKTYLLNTYSAKKLGLKTTGNASRSIAGRPGVGISNFYLINGNISEKDLIGEVKDGLYLMETMGAGVNPVTGDFSVGALGMWIENGKILYPVSEITIASNINGMLNNILGLGDNLEFRGAYASPSLLIDKITVSGK
ncbi:MAG: TldD/PmbA family protein [Acidobacteriota bacterium]